MKYIFILLAGLVLFPATACKKSDPLSTPFTPDMLYGIKWETVSIITKANPSSPETDVFSGIPEFQKDDYFIFSADSTYELNDSEILRNDTATRIIDAGVWSIQHRENSQFLEMTSNTFSTEYQPGKIIELNENNLLLERVFPSDQSIIRTRYRSVN